MKLLFSTVLMAAAAVAAPIVTYTVTGDFAPVPPATTNSACDISLTSTCQTTGTSGGRVRYLMGFGSVDLGVLNPSNITFGTIFTFGNVGSLNGKTLTLTVNQTTPFAGSDSTTGTLSGKVRVNASNAFLFFTDPILNIGNVTYTIFQGDKGIALVPPSTDSTGALQPGSTTIQGTVTAPTPEPATMALMGMGLIGLGFVARRRNA